MVLHIILLVSFIFSAIVFGAVFKEAIEDWDSGKDPILWLPGLIMGGFFFVISGTAIVTSIWLIVLDFGLV